MVSVRDFNQMRMLGRGAFGCVNACKKKDTGKLYAMKQINKRRVQATESVDTIMAEVWFFFNFFILFVLHCAQLFENAWMCLFAYLGTEIASNG